MRVFTDYNTYIKAVEKLNRDYKIFWNISYFQTRKEILLRTLLEAFSIKIEDAELKRQEEYQKEVQRKNSTLEYQNLIKEIALRNKKLERKRG